MLSSPETVADYLMEEVRYLTKERVYALFMSSSGSLLKKVMLSEGSISASIISSAELMKEALRCNATGLVIVHNHPSGNPEPSEQDILVTEHIKKICEQFNIQFLDHLIIGDGRYYSFRNEN